MSIYTAIADALDFVYQLTQLSDIDLIVAQKLWASAGKCGVAFTDETGATVNAGTPVFRFYFVAAKLVEQSRDDQTLEAADGAKFTGLARSIQSWYMEQTAIDGAYQLAVPPGFASPIYIQGISPVQAEGGYRDYPAQYGSEPSQSGDLVRRTSRPVGGSTAADWNRY
jgi:hypothetical protein